MDRWMRRGGILQNVLGDEGRKQKTNRNGRLSVWIGSSWTDPGALLRAILPPNDISVRTNVAPGGRGGATARMHVATSHPRTGQTLQCVPEVCGVEGNLSAQERQCPCMEREMAHSPLGSPCSLRLARIIHSYIQTL
mmetsp:Transcript_6053/g.37507  ORF Transcript_6053/g.37507 Transcript_6053/m.37507 type:complete len:137 (+) Transcript_6053:2537-2947(+)